MSEQTEKIQQNATAKKNAHSNVNVPLEEFDWSAHEIGIKDEEIQEREKIRALYNDNLKTINEHEILKGVVTKILEKEVIVDINFKSEGVISLNEFRDNADLKVGDVIDVMVEKREYKGQLILSHRKAKTLRAWERAKEAYKNGEIITGKITGRTKGGMIVKVLDHIEAFMPGSQIDHKPLSNFEAFFTETYNKTMEFKIIKINHEFKNIVVSHKALIEADIEKQKKKFMSELQPGQVIMATVKNITGYGAFCDMGGVDGLVHHTDISWKRINHPSEVLKVNQEVKVVILDFNEEKNRIQLGMKQLLPHPWENLDENLKPGDKVKGRVTAITEYGAFVEIENHPGVEALLHVSEMSWSSQLRMAKDFVKAEDVIEGVILTIDRQERKMSLGMKQLTPDPWIDVENKYPIGSKHTGVIRNFTNYGIFIELEEGVDGMVHNSDLLWSKKVKHASELFKIGDSIDTVVLELDTNNRRLNLGHKQLNENPWEAYEKKYSLESIHKGKIIDLFDKGGTIHFEEQENIHAFAPLRYLEKQDGTRAKKGEELPFKVIEFNKEFKRIVVSHTSTFRDEEKKNVEEATKRQRIEKSTLGDFDELAQLKKKMERNNS